MAPLRFVPRSLGLALIALLAACGSGNQAGSGAGQRLGVVATTTQAADLAANVGGADVDVVGLLAPNTDPHRYELRPRDVQALTRAGLIVRSGGEIDQWLSNGIKASGTKAHVVSLIDSVKTIRGPSGARATDPHWWQDPRNGALATVALGAAFARADPRRAADYRSAAARYASRLRKLDTAIAGCWKTVPPAQRKLVTTHDALGYYARRYGLKVIGAVIPSLSTQGAPSAGDVADLVRLIRRAKVRAIFAESSVNTKVEQAIARETGAKVGHALWADTLGPARSDGATYLKSLASNTRAMIDGVTAGAVTCKLPS
jgi:ABC-type Zn uptake system ZnuABC Zn-binding protein ZnuA